MTAYAELHCHSTFSLLDGASDPERLVERRAVAQRRQHVVREAAARRRVVHVVGDDPRQVE